MYFPSIWEILLMTFISFKIVRISLESNLSSFILSCSSRNHSTLVARINLIFFKVCSFCLCLKLLAHSSSDFSMSSLGAQGSFFEVQASPDTFQVTYVSLKKKRKNMCFISCNLCFLSSQYFFLL